MLKLLWKTIGYFAILICLILLGVTKTLTYQWALLLAGVLAVINTFLRPILLTAALPLNVLTFGIASVFANLLMLVTANAIVGRPLAGIGFWILLATAFIIMLYDDMVYAVRSNPNCRRWHMA